jgi:hypothetical protein
VNKFILAAALLAGLSAQAQEKKLEIVNESAKFTALNADSMNPASVYFQFTEAPLPFTEWMAKNPNEYAFLALYDGYTEPTLLTRKKKTPITEKMTMFVAKAKTIINKPASAVNLKGMITLPFIQKLDPEIRHAQIAPGQIMPIVGGQPSITNFQKLCNAEGKYIVRPSLELALDKLNRPGQSWCADASRSICVESCYIFNSGYRTVVSGYNKFKAEDEYDKKDFGMATQSEIRYFVSEAEMGKKIPVAALTGINTPVRGALEQNIFYFNQMVQYGKIVAFFQENPKDASKTIVTSFLVFGIQSSTYEKVYSLMGLELSVKDILMGRGGRLNTASGITAGLPIYTQNIAKSLSRIIEN